MKLATTDQLREIDRRTKEEFLVPGLILMENAALRVVDLLQDRFKNLEHKMIAVVCGKGNNGGDGLAIARHLANRLHAKVIVWLLAEESQLKGEALAQCQIAKAYGLDMRRASEIDLSKVEIVVDAIFGTGFKGAVTGDAAKIIEVMNESGKQIISVDVPSGLDSDTGKIEGVVVRATLTVTFVLAKFGMLSYPGVDYVGELIVANIGTPQALIDSCKAQNFSTDTSDVAKWLPIRTNGRDANKGSFGHVFIFAGSKDFVGAPILVAEAASRVGAGLVTLVVPNDLKFLVTSHVSPEVMTKGLEQTDDGYFSRAAIEPALALIKKANVVAIGPGIGEDDELAEFVRALIIHCPVALVLDADALNILSKEPDKGVSLIKNRKATTILTPHPAEMGRLLGVETKSIQEDRRSNVVKASGSYSCVALLKGARTLVAAPDGKIYVNTTGNAGMATGGAGDVLTGVIAGLLAQDLNSLEAAAAGVYVHGLAGDLVSIHIGGTTGIVASDLIAKLPEAIARSQNQKKEIVKNPGELRETSCGPRN